MRAALALLLMLLVLLTGPAEAQAQSMLGHQTPVVQPLPTPLKKAPAKPTAKPMTRPAPAVPAPAPAPAPISAPPAVVATPNPAAPPAPVEPAIGSDSKLPLPRFMSLNNDPVNMRDGPGRTETLLWIYHRRDLPVEVVRERESWRLVRDPDNVRGWISAIALSTRRTFIVQGGDRTVRSRSDDSAPPVAILRVGVVGRLLSCQAGSLWCEASVSGYRGFLKRAEIWGVGADEVVQ